ncbi:MAG: nitrophenyl compound nitroreductase subunit ArsF family protein [Candidatus Zixiibacteriota bacterium]|jgi:hypothetical protein
MKPKTVVAVVLLAFVAVALGYLIIKEVKAARAPEPVAAGTAEPETAAPGDAEPEPGVPPDKVVVTYFYFGKRCAACQTIEALSREAVESGFPEEMAEGRVAWRAVNTDDAGNGRYIDDYELFAKAVIVSEMRDGREARWKNLMDVWKLYKDRDAFIAYVQKEVRASLEGR